MFLIRSLFWFWLLVWSYNSLVVKALYLQLRCCGLDSWLIHVAILSWLSKLFTHMLIGHHSSIILVPAEVQWCCISVSGKLTMDLALPCSCYRLTVTPTYGLNGLWLGDKHPMYLWKSMHDACFRIVGIYWILYLVLVSS